MSKRSINRAVDSVMTDILKKNNLIKTNTIIPGQAIPNREEGALPLMQPFTGKYYADVSTRQNLPTTPYIFGFPLPARPITPSNDSREAPRYTGVEPYQPPIAPWNPDPFRRIIRTKPWGGILNHGEWPGRSITTGIPTLQQIQNLDGKPIPRPNSTVELDPNNPLNLEGLGAFDWQGALVKATGGLVSGEQDIAKTIDAAAETAKEAARQKYLTPDQGKASTPALPTPAAAAAPSEVSRFKVPLAIGAVGLAAYFLMKKKR